MRIQHNIMAMNAYRNYNNNTSALSKNLEKLSSGYKINRAGDDAAGLAISEKMRAQITGLQAATKNVKDGVSLVKTAEGAMQEIHDMLNRMDYLANQSANGTYDNEVDRANLQKEVDSLRSEIDRIADSANFNGIKLLDGSLEDGADLTLRGNIDIPNVGTVQGTSTVVHKEAGAGVKKTTFEVNLHNVSFDAKQAGDTLKLTVGGHTLTATAGAAQAYTGKDLADLFAADNTGGNTAGKVTIDGQEFNVTATNTGLKFEQAADATDTTLVNGNVAVKLGAVTGTGAAVTGDYNLAATNIQNATLDSGARLASTSFELTKDMVTDGSSITIGKTTYTFKALNGAAAPAGQNVVDITGLDGTKADDLVQIAAKLTAAANANTTYSVGHDGATSTITLTEKANQTDFQANGKSSLTSKEAIQATLSVTGAPATGKALTLQIGDTSDGFNQLSVKVGDMHTKAMGTKGGKSIADISIAMQSDAADAVNVIKDAINYVSSVRGDLGATQNRLEHTQNNLSVMTENIQDAESTIRDTDVADEMMAYTKNNILIQSAQAMLAQANQVPQGVLQLLQ